MSPAGSQVQLLGVDANPHAISLENVWSYSELHGMLHDWHFLTGSLPQLTRVWKQYAIEAAVEAGQITHTPANQIMIIGNQQPQLTHRSSPPSVWSPSRLFPLHCSRYANIRPTVLPAHASR